MNYPPKSKLTIVALAMVGAVIGMAVFLTIESKAPSYLSSDSAACANCHVMHSAYNTWHQSSHREWAQCNDCHIPHENIIRKYAAKAQDGMRHSWVFTMETYGPVMKASAKAKSIIQSNCVRCHESLLVASPAHNADLISAESQRHCTECHRHVPHGKGNSVSSSHRKFVSSGKSLFQP